MQGRIAAIRHFFVGDLEGADRGTHVGILIDVSEQRILERSLTEASMREQHRIGMNLHDGLGPEWTGLSQIAEIARRALDSARTVAHGLSPIEPGVHGFFQAIRRLASAMQSAGGFEIPVILNGAAADVRLEQTSLESVFHIAQEAIPNEIKHGLGSRAAGGRGDRRFRHQRHALSGARARRSH